MYVGGVFNLLIERTNEGFVCHDNERSNFMKPKNIIISKIIVNFSKKTIYMINVFRKLFCIFLYKFLLYRTLTVSRVIFILWIFIFICRAPWTSDRPVAWPLPKYRTTQTQNKRTHLTSMAEVGFEPTITASE
jgi:hypothetical protein